MQQKGLGRGRPGGELSRSAENVISAAIICVNARHLNAKPTVRRTNRTDAHLDKDGGHHSCCGVCRDSDHFRVAVRNTFAIRRVQADQVRVLHSCRDKNQNSLCVTSSSCSSELRPASCALSLQSVLTRVAMNITCNRRPLSFYTQLELGGLFH